MSSRELLIRLLPALLLTFLMAGLVGAEGEFDPERDVPLQVTFDPDPVPAGGRGNLVITLALPPNTHITSVENGFFFVTPDTNAQIEWGISAIPTGVVAEGETVYRGRVVIPTSFSLKPGAAVGSKIEIAGTVGYQICTEVDPIFCTPPHERRFTGTITVGEEGVAGGSVTTDDQTEQPLTIEQKARRALESGSAMALFWVFIGGVLLSFTPCVYPIVPITIAFIGGKSHGNKLKGFTLSLVFVLGLGIVYSSLGLVAALTGGVFGLTTQNPWVIGFVAIVFLIMGNGMLGAFEMALPSSIQQALHAKKRSGYIGALFVGATTGLVAVPCVGPVLVALLSWVASTGKVVTGLLYLFVFACGLGLLFVVIGTLAGAFTALPKSGGWMERVKHFFGFIMIAAAYYFARPFIPEDWFILAVGFGFLATAGVFGAFTRLEDHSDFIARTTKAIATFLLIAGVFYTWLGLAKFQGLASAMTGGLMVSSSHVTASPAAPEHKTGVQWLHTSPEEALQMAKSSGKPLMIDFWAEWCAACKELDHKTFSKPEVSDLINSRFIPLKVDGTKITPELKAIWASYGVKGLPTVVFLKGDGAEVERFEAFRTVEETMPVLKRVLGG